MRATSLATIRTAIAVWIALLSSCNDSSVTRPPSPSGEHTPPWQRSEERESCADSALLRNPYFGDLHIHTRYSADAYTYGTRVGPREAYDFARGEAITLSDDDEQQTRSARIDRPLDFAAVTDHAEFFGEVDLCSQPGSAVYDDPLCAQLRQVEAPEDRFLVTVAWLFPAGIDNPPRSHAFCSLPGIDCDAAAVSVWQEIQAAAEEAYDRTAACTFTSLIGYEHTASPLGRHLHRNVIFRNHHVPRFAASQLETASEGVPQGLWRAIESECLNAGTGCDALLIPHNSNLSGGMRWQDPGDATEAQRRQDREPLVEIHQIKANSECRFDRLAGAGVGTEDELCSFEQQAVAHEGIDNQPPPSIEEYPRRNLVRNVLKDGLALEDSLGVNPFKLGFIGSTDTHNANAGDTEEAGWSGIQGNTDASPERRISRNLDTNPGGLAVVWAEENSRDAIFAALRRRETYATSGTRPVVRFFGGSLAEVDCGDADLVRRAYETGTPMGGDLGAVRGNASPRFAVLAVKDPGTAEAPGTDLQRVQIVKGWADPTGTTHERVFDVAGDAGNGATVDRATCETVGRGARELCAVWEDPEFDATERAFYYVRVLENPTCRWSTLTCKSAGVDPFSPSCAAQAAATDQRFADCCLTQESQATFEPTIQERAWTSPIWYHPDGIARIEGAIELSDRPGRDSFRLSLGFGRLPSAIDPQRVDIKLRIEDDDQIFSMTLPDGSWQATPEPGVLELRDIAVGTGTLRRATLNSRAKGAAEATLDLEGVDLDLGAADRNDHPIRITLESGTYRFTHVRFWRVRQGGLSPVVE